LDDIHQTISACRDCDLCQERTQTVPGEGSAQAGIMFVGEGPGQNEDIQGRPFIGAAGGFLTHLLESIGLRREDVFITNMVKCRPPNNRDPLPEEMAACKHYLDEQIAEIAPKIIVPLGRHALARWFPGEAIGKVRAQPRSLEGQTLFPLYHPAAALHNGGLRATIEEDFAKLGALLDEMGGVEPTLAPAPAPALEPPPQAPEPEASVEPAEEPEPEVSPEPAPAPQAEQKKEPPPPQASQQLNMF
jgi:uracil-DNA glycosylase